MEEIKAIASSSSSSASSAAFQQTISTGGLNTLLTTHFPTIQPLTPIRNNIYAAICTIIYVKIVMEVGSLIRVKFGLPELSRKFLHLCACSSLVFWPLFDSEHWGWRLNVTVPVAMSLRLLYKVRSWSVVCDAVCIHLVYRVLLCASPLLVLDDSSFTNQLREQS